jgi:hypothetical protein
VAEVVREVEASGDSSRRREPKRSVPSKQRERRRR